MKKEIIDEKFRRDIKTYLFLYNITWLCIMGFEKYSQFKKQKNATIVLVLLGLLYEKGIRQEIN